MGFETIMPAFSGARGELTDPFRNVSKTVLFETDVRGHEGYDS
jgi:hypothetical protein